MSLANVGETNGRIERQSGPPVNVNAFKYGLAAIQKRREDSVTIEYEEGVRQQIFDGLIADKGGMIGYRQPLGF
jgi:hypothetical protein